MTPASAPSAAQELYRNAFKRALDLALIVFVAPIWLPVILVGAFLAALDGHNPFYRQERVGRFGRTFWIWKLRTMVVNADAKLEAYLDANPEARAEWDATQKLKHDPRITLVGRILRKTSLDELPQLFNVLIGDMSLVGPRPMMVSQKDLYTGDGYYTVRPGLTGLWQVSDRNECRFIDRVSYDETYAAKMSFGMDLSILMRTVGVVVRGTGY
ncbi:MAG: sugar transferase [Pseudomonadota bacterium]